MSDEDFAQLPTGAHVPVLLERTLDLLGPAVSAEGTVLVDGTLGLGGHSAAFLAAFPFVRLVGLDRDSEALERSAQRLKPFADRVTLVHAVYDELPAVLASLGIDSVQAALFDLGVSSMQLDLTERGFSYAHDAPLDMRMDPTQALTAEEVVNSYSVARLARVINQFGEERFALRIAQSIARTRDKHRLTSTQELAELVKTAIPAATRRTGGHPAKRTFQALRIEVNGELDALRVAIPAALGSLSIGGRIVVLAYQSLEDRIVKQSLAAVTTDRTPVGLPVALASSGPQFRLLSRGSEPASAEEVTLNPRAASVRLRAAERIRLAAA